MKNNKFWNFVKNEDTNETELLFNGPISEDTWFGDEVTPALFRDELSKVKGDLTVWLNSPGGDVFAASQIYTMLRNHKGKVTVKINALAASASFVNEPFTRYRLPPSSSGIIFISSSSRISFADIQPFCRAVA